MTATPAPSRFLAEDTLRALGLPAHEATTIYASETGTSLTVPTPKGQVCITEFNGAPAYASVDVCRSDFSVIVSGRIFTGADERYLNEITLKFLRNVIEKFNA